MGTDGAAWGVRLLLVIISACYVGWLWWFLCPAGGTMLLFASLLMVLPAFGFPPTSNAHPCILYLHLSHSIVGLNVKT